jgi:4-amino-4-deoxy-L-arabinose transferase-like glycosyltransferase
MNTIQHRLALLQGLWSRSSWILVVMLFALVIRLAFVLVVDPTPHMDGGDSRWYLLVGRALLDDKLTAVLASGPVYFVYTGLLQKIFGDATPQVIRILNGVMGAALCGFVYVIGRRYFSQLTGLVAAFVIAVNPMFIIEAGAVMTETVFVFLLLAALAIYAANEDRLDWRYIAVVGALLALASLTRAVALAFPLILIMHLFYMLRRRAVPLVLVLVTVYVLVLSTWTIYNLAKYGRFVVAADGLMANVYLGTTDQGWCGAKCVDEQAGITTDANNQTQYLDRTLAALASNLGGYVSRRLSNLLESLLQPHNTPYYPGQSIKQLAADWWSRGHSISGLGVLLASDNFWPKLALYVFHFGALCLGLVGMLLGIRQFGARLPAYAMVGYFLGVHLVLTALPRYFFPAEPGWILFGAFALITLAHRLKATSRVSSELVAST